ncbi:MAG: NifB/NifX family molybdenum-iron cluster-binding protein [Candidatus Aminicenantes bacterium]|nr:MAG: NifB/NifX family molybdenum-iron cluster-binding protein [Candidatus Aminicenantes bacterium]
MRVFIAVESNAGLDSKLDNRFGRAGCFIVYDMEEEKIISIEENMFKNDAHEVGIKIASFVVGKGCRAAIGAQPGPKAAAVLEKAKIKMIPADQGTVKELIGRFKSQLKG